MPRLQQLGNAIFVVFLMGFVFLLAYRPNWDIDIFWHIAAGKWIVENGRLPSTDIFAYTDPSRAWSSFQWLYEVITYELDSHIGFWAVRGLHTALFLGTFVAWFLFLRRYLPQKSLVIAFVMLLVALSLDRLRVRPEAFNFFFLAILLPFIFGGASRERGLPKWWEFVVGPCRRHLGQCSCWRRCLFTSGIRRGICRPFARMVCWRTHPRTLAPHDLFILAWPDQRFGNAANAKLS